MKNVSTSFFAVNKSPLLCSVLTLLILSIYFIAYRYQTSLIDDITRNNEDILFSQVSSDVYKFCAVIMAGCTINSMLFLTCTRSSTGKCAAIICLGIQLISAHSDYCVAQGHAVIWLDFQNQPIFLIRYIHWGTSTVLLVSLCAYMTKVTWRSTAIACGIQSFIVCGGVASLLVSSKLVRGLLAVYCMSGYLTLASMARACVQQKEKQGVKSENRKHSFRVAFYLACLVWSIFPVVFYSNQMRLISFVQAEMAICAVNFLAKAMMPMMIMFHAMLTHEETSRILTKISSSHNLNLLRLILPDQTISRIQAGEELISDFHPHVGILFTDIVGFTPLSSSLDTSETFKILNTLFSGFDALMAKHGVYKVETIGDAYMIAAGHDEDKEKSKLGSPVDRLIAVGKEMLKVAKTIILPSGKSLQIRVGIHCGSAYSGVVSMMCPRYCFIGDTVNTASRMESTSYPMAIHVSHSVFQASVDKTQFQQLPNLFVKGKGLMTTYVVKAGYWEEAVETAEELAKKDLLSRISNNVSTDVMEDIQSLQEANLGLRKQIESIPGSAELSNENYYCI